MRYTLGIDIGTSSAKAVLLDPDGNVVFTAAPQYPFRTPKPLWAESDPDDWWNATVTAIRAIGEKHNLDDVAAIGLTGQMHGLVLLNGQGEVLRPCIMWNDQRTAVECAALTKRVGAERVLKLTGNPVLPGFTAPKVLWVQQHEPEVWQRARHILLPKDYIRFRLTGEFFSDVSDASGTSLLDVGARRWSEEMCEACGVASNSLPEVTESTIASSQISPEVARITGLPENLSVIAGGGDQAAGAVGCGIVRGGRVSCTLGTSGVLFAHADKYRPDPRGRLHTFCAAVPGKWHFMGVQLSCAGAYQWLRDKLFPESGFTELNQWAEDVYAGSEGLYFLPYLTGERTPHPDPNAKGVFYGLHLSHGRGHFARAVMEGVTYGLRDTLEIMRDLGIAPEDIIASGGGSKSPLWRQILADNFATRIITVNTSEGAAYGAAVLAQVGAGMHSGVEAACDHMIRETSETKPSGNREKYDEAYPLFKDLYPALKTLFNQ